MSHSELEVGGSRSVVAVPFYPDLAFLAWVAPGRSPARQSSHLSSHSLSHSSACLSAAAAGNSDLAQNGFRVRWCYCWGIFHFACSPWFITPPGLTQKWLYLFNLCLFVRLFIWIKPMILIFFFLLFKTIVEREVKYPASGVGFGLKPWAGQTSGVLSLFFFCVVMPCTHCLVVSSREWCSKGAKVFEAQTTCLLLPSLGNALGLHFLPAKFSCLAAGVLRVTWLYLGVSFCGWVYRGLCRWG